MKPLTKTVVSRGGGIAARFAQPAKGGDAPGTPAQPSIPRHDKPPAVSAKPAAGAKPRVANSVANPVANVANEPRYARWRKANPELYRQRQRQLMRKRRAKEREE